MKRLSFPFLLLCSFILVSCCENKKAEVSPSTTEETADRSIDLSENILKLYPLPNKFAEEQRALLFSDTATNDDITFPVNEFLNTALDQGYYELYADYSHHISQDFLPSEFLKHNDFLAIDVEHSNQLYLFTDASRHQEFETKLNSILEKNDKPTHSITCIEVSLSEQSETIDRQFFYFERDSSDDIKTKTLNDHGPIKSIKAIPKTDTHLLEVELSISNTPLIVPFKKISPDGFSKPLSSGRYELNIIPHKLNQQLLNSWQTSVVSIPLQSLSSLRKLTMLRETNTVEFFRRFPVPPDFLERLSYKKENHIPLKQLPSWIPASFSTSQKISCYGISEVFGDMGVKIDKLLYAPSISIIFASGDPANMDKIKDILTPLYTPVDKADVKLTLYDVPINEVHGKELFEQFSFKQRDLVDQVFMSSGLPNHFTSKTNGTIHSLEIDCLHSSYPDEIKAEVNFKHSHFSETSEIKLPYLNIFSRDKIQIPIGMNASNKLRFLVIESAYFRGSWYRPYIKRRY